MNSYFRRPSKVLAFIALIIVVFLMVTGQLALVFVPCGIATLAAVCQKMGNSAGK
ncbi:MAG: hypothetical protein UDB11_01010 [Peptococcaceae bacterium]|nr:hypothetical protein [Peptococcaceae bacterium]